MTKERANIQAGVGIAAIFLACQNPPTKSWDNIYWTLSGWGLFIAGSWAIINAVDSGYAPQVAQHNPQNDPLNRLNEQQ